MKYVISIFMLVLLLAIGGCSDQGDAIRPVSYPFEVRNATAVRTDSTTVRLSWDRIGNVTHVMIHRGWGANFPSTMIADLAGDATQYFDLNVPKDSLCLYQVIGENLVDATSSPVLAVGVYRGAISYATEIRPLLNACVGCHGVSGGWSVDGLTAAVNNRTLANFRGISGSLLVVPNNLSNSELYQRVELTSGATMMPQGGPQLSLSSRILIRDWIQSGANP